MTNLFLTMAFSWLVYAPAWAMDKMMITGSSTMAPLVTELAKSYQKIHTGAKIEVQTGGSAKGVSDCRNKLTDLGMVSRDLDATESDLVVTPIAKDGLAFTVHRDNPVKNITTTQVIDIYTGKISNWATLGGPDRKIVVVSKAEGRGTLDLFLHYFKLKSSELKAEIIIGDEEQGIKTVASTPGAIAYLSVSATDGIDSTSSGIHTVSLDGIAATSERVRTNDYKVSRLLSLISCKTGNPDRDNFLRYVTSNDGQGLVRALRFIPLR